ncbi:MAG TPA: TolC family protein [Ferruginibacter sp.]|jgi:outer membrane protein|nr:TolC family protein [Ferruginibacter sp.]
MRYGLYTLIILLFTTSIKAQEKWDLRHCVDYALANNISIKQTDVQAKIAQLQYKENKLSQYPAANFTGDGAYNSGRNQDPTTFSLITQSYLSAGFQLQTSANIFNWYSKQNSIIASRWEADAAKASVDKLKNDIVLSVANAYLQILLSKAQQNIALLQLHLSEAQLSNTKKLVAAGSLPELNAAELEAQVATDTANYINAKGAVDQNVLVLKSYMNVDAATPFDVDSPPAELIPIESFADLQPEDVYNLAIVNLPQQRVNEFKLKAAQKDADAAKDAMYPTLAAFGTLNSSYLDYKTALYDPIIVGYNPTPYSVNVGGTSYTVQSPIITNGNKIGYAKSDPFGTQLSDNFRQSAGLSLTIPIFSGWSLHGAWEQSKLNTRNLELQKDADNQTLKQNIYQAYNAAVVAMEKFNASKKTVDASQRTFDFSQKRYDVGMIGTFELITNQNNLFTAKLQYVQDQFDYVFKMKVLEFYKGQGLKL